MLATTTSPPSTTKSNIPTNGLKLKTTNGLNAYLPPYQKNIISTRFNLL
jgi:hypothetical protein